MRKVYAENEDAGFKFAVLPGGVVYLSRKYQPLKVGDHGMRTPRDKREVSWNLPCG